MGQEDRSQLIGDFSLLYTVHKMMAMAMTYLRKFESDVCSLFLSRHRIQEQFEASEHGRSKGYAKELQDVFLTRVEELKTIKEHLEASEYGKFKKFAQELQELFLTQAEELKTMKGHADVSVLLPILFGHVSGSAWEDTDSQECQICGHSKERIQILLEEIYQPSDNIGAMFNATVERLSAHQNRCLEDDMVALPEVLKERSRFFELLGAVKVEAIRVLRHNRLYDGMPQLSRTNPVYLPKELWSFRSILARAHTANRGSKATHNTPSRFLAETFDCLGRTHMHRFLDYGIINHARFLAVKYELTRTEHFDTQDMLGRSLLHIACQKGYTELVKELLTRGANASAQTVLGTLPLHYAAAQGHAEICKVLLSAPNVDVEKQDKLGNTALLYAERGNHEEVVKLIRLHMSDDIERNALNVHGVADPPILWRHWL